MKLKKSLLVTFSICEKQNILCFGLKANYRNLYTYVINIMVKFQTILKSLQKMLHMFIKVKF